MNAFVVAKPPQIATAAQFHLSGFEDRETLEADVPRWLSTTTGDGTHSTQNKADDMEMVQMALGLPQYSLSMT